MASFLFVLRRGLYLWWCLSIFIVCLSPRYKAHDKSRGNVSCERYGTEEIVAPWQRGLVSFFLSFLFSSFSSRRRTDWSPWLIHLARPVADWKALFQDAWLDDLQFDRSFWLLREPPDFGRAALLVLGLSKRTRRHVCLVCRWSSSSLGFEMKRKRVDTKGR